MSSPEVELRSVPAVEDLRYGFDLAVVDPASLNAALATAVVRLARDPATTGRALGELALDQAAAAGGMLRRLAGADGDDSPAPGDFRFADRAWTENPFLRGLLESYLASGRSARRLLEAADLPEPKRRKAAFALELILDALSPSNVPWLNPGVVKEAIDTGGISLARGLRNFVDDLVRNGGLPRQVDDSGFELGRDLAATPGRVVFRNELLELLAYEPQTADVLAEPLLYVPSWINKYYVLDLAAERSFVEHAVRQGVTVLAISWRNPDASLAAVTLDDYLRDGFLAALEATERIAGGPRVNVLGVCIGGTLSTIGLAVLAARGEAARVGSAALLNTLVDYDEPGEIGAFADEATIERIERRMDRRGYLAPSELTGPFTWMRSNDLVWRYVVANWYRGEQPPAFDILAWNADSTRLPAAMHSQFLRACYLDNLLVRPDALVIDGTAVDVGRVETPLYVLAAEKDHIAPWRSTYRTTQLVGGEARFILVSGGHIAGMVSPPGGRGWYRTRGDNPADPDAWLDGSERLQGSWWDDWLRWATERSSGRVPPPALAPGEPAPGGYVRVRF
jgi:polyhydroxyalkanoate synthase